MTTSSLVKEAPLCCVLFQPVAPSHPNSLRNRDAQIDEAPECVPFAGPFAITVLYVSRKSPFYFNLYPLLRRKYRVKDFTGRTRSPRGRNAIAFIVRILVNVIEIKSNVRGSAKFRLMV